jgi:antitoxin FitA
MAQILVRNIEDAVKARLQRRAKRNGRSMEEEVREILREVLRRREPRRGLGSEMVALFSGSGVTLRQGEEIPEIREMKMEIPHFEP